MKNGEPVIQLLYSGENHSSAVEIACSLVCIRLQLMSEIWSFTFLISNCWKAAWAGAPKPHLWKPFSLNCPFHIALLHCGKQGSWGSRLLFLSSWTSPPPPFFFFHLVKRFCLLLLRMFPSWSRMKQAKLLLVSLFQSEEIACSLS